MMESNTCSRCGRSAEQHLDDGVGGTIPLCARHSTMSWQQEQLNRALRNLWEELEPRLVPHLLVMSCIGLSVAFIAWQAGLQDVLEIAIHVSFYSSMMIVALKTVNVLTGRR